MQGLRTRLDASMAVVVQEFRGFMETKTDTKLVIDSSPKDDLLRINFNIRYAITDIWILFKRSLHCQSAGRMQHRMPV